ncbi:hypothetical protein ACLOJK_021701 [Asimina triloba]
MGTGSLIRPTPSQHFPSKNLARLARPSFRFSTNSPPLAAAAASALLMKQVAVIGSGMSGAVCAAALAGKGLAVSVFESGRGPGGRTSQRRETSGDGRDLLFDHGAPFFTAKSDEMISLVSIWEAKSLVAEWKKSFGCFDRINRKFLNLEMDGIESQATLALNSALSWAERQGSLYVIDREGSIPKYVGVPGMNSVCKALCAEPGVNCKFGVTIGKLDWLEDRSMWLLTALDGANLGQFDGVVLTDKNIASPRFTGQTGRPPPLDISLVPEVAKKLHEIPVRSCFALMLAFSEPLSFIPVKGFSFRNSEVLSWAFCDSSKPGRYVGSHHSEKWVLHSTAEYAREIIAQTGLQKPSNATLTKVADELFQEFQSVGFNVPQPFFMKAHRGSAFPADAVAREEGCLYDKSKRLAICGDFCVSPSVEGAVLSGMQAAAKLVDIFSRL